MAASRFTVSFKGWRDTLLFLSGLAGVGYETVYSQADRPTLLLLFAAMMGLPAFLRSDEARSKNDSPDPPTPVRTPVPPEEG